MCLKIQFHDTQDYVKCTKGIQRISATSHLHFRKLNLQQQSECMQGTSAKDQDHPWKCKTATCTIVKMQTAKLHNANAANTCYRPHPLHSKAHILPSSPFFTNLNRMCLLSLVLLHREYVQVWLGIMVKIDIWSLFTDFLSCSELCIVEFKLLRTEWRWESEVWFGIPAFYYPISPHLFPPLYTTSSS